MRASYSGELSVKKRTSMHLDDVLELLGSGKVISLGRSQGREFLLFCQLSDKEGRIAIVTEDREVLISIQTISYNLPFNLMVPIKSLVPVARKLFNDFVFEKAKLSHKIETEDEASCLMQEHIRIRVVIRYESDVLHEVEVSKEYSREKLDSAREIISFFKEDFYRIATVVGESVKKSLGRITYTVSIFNQETDHFRRRSKTIFHRNLLRYLGVQPE